MRKYYLCISLAFLIGAAVGTAGLYSYITHLQHVSVAHTKESTDDAIAEYTLWLMIFTGVLAVATIGLGAATAGLYLTSEKQVNVTRETLIAEQRAWIVTALEIGKSGISIGRGHDGILLDARLKVTNVGRTPAINAHTIMGLVTDIYKVQEEVRKLAMENKKSRPENGLVVAPNDFYYRPWYPSADVDLKTQHVTVILIGAVTYEILQDQELHQTAFAYLIGRNDGTHWGAPITLAQSEVKPENLTIAPWAGGFAS